MASRRLSDKRNLLSSREPRSETKVAPGKMGNLAIASTKVQLGNRTIPCLKNLPRLLRSRGTLLVSSAGALCIEEDLNLESPASSVDLSSQHRRFVESQAKLPDV